MKSAAAKMSEFCEHGIRHLATNLPYCRRCDEANQRYEQPKSEMKSAEEWANEIGFLVDYSEDAKPDKYRIEPATIAEIQADAYKAGQAATMKWVSEECAKMLASIPVEHHHKD